MARVSVVSFPSESSAIVSTNVIPRLWETEAIKSPDEVGVTLEPLTEILERSEYSSVTLPVTSVDAASVHSPRGGV